MHLTAKPSLVKGYIRQTFEEGSTLIESKLRTVAGDVPYLFNGLRVKLDGELYILGVALDISKQKKLEGLLKREATTDHLTGLYNRQRFDSEILRALARHAHYGTETALVLIDLDHFKRVNDTYGHDVGDRIIVEVTERLTGAGGSPIFWPVGAARNSWPSLRIPAPLGPPE